MGLSVDEVTENINRKMPIVFSVSRARAVARTEMHNAFEAGNRMAVDQSTLPRVKIWLASEDERTRQGHSEIDGESVPLNQNFSVPLYDHEGSLLEKTEMVGPGDPSAPAGQVINCRCTLLYELADQ